MNKKDEGRSLKEKMSAFAALLEREGLQTSILREKVLALVPVRDLLDEIGTLLIPKEEASSAPGRMLYYLRQYPGVVVNSRELMVVAGISEWARRIRELRVQKGWPIISGLTAREMLESGEELGAEAQEIREMRSDDYILFGERPDEGTGARWKMANKIRKTKLGAREKILEYLKANVAKPVTGEELRYVAGNATEWARRARELRTEFGWPIATRYSGRPDLPAGSYVLESDRQMPPHDRRIPDAVRSAVLKRDGYKCVECGWHHGMWNPSDPRHLEPHHVKPHAEGGENVESNLITLCTVCHDKRHAEMNRA